ncbi:MAG: prolyl oligopeptidase family serine peptidase, partial [Lachnospiraceae bacterium]|nr:prolyl oligopeptidase family serine peptidase [Lachnospiraceae bacterium]
MARGYIAVVRVTDNGPYVTEFILPVGRTLKQGAVDKDTFTVYVEKYDMEGNPVMVNKRRPKFMGEQVEKAARKGYIEIRDAYVSDLQGEKKEEGEYITLKTAFGPVYSLTAEVEYRRFNEYVATFHTIAQKKEIVDGDDVIVGLVYDKKIENRQPDLYGWIDSVSTYEELPLKYGYFVPQEKGGLHPLVIWLHGAGEGGQDPKAAYSANRVVALSQKHAQDLFGGAYVLAPQCPTFWMDSGSGGIEFNGKTKYTPSLLALIDEFIEKNPGIDKNRIYIGGDSNGGFMTLRLVLDFPERWTAAFPVCEAVPDDTITDEQIENIKNVPIWFVTCEEDTTVPPEKCPVATYRRLKAAGAPDVHCTMWDVIEDIHGNFEPVDGKPYKYYGHFSWVPTLNDDCRLDLDKKPVVYN